MGVDHYAVLSDRLKEDAVVGDVSSVIGFRLYWHRKRDHQG
ncbi:hypothetical protein OCQ_17240 [Mycobacterium paraintracellulare]|nr:hypothetical protein OCQ_17240 [Mycobacterium paraintracellulare]